MHNRTLSLNLDDEVTPNHFKVEQFEAFPGLTVDEEFDLVALICIYYHASLDFKAKAREALKTLRKLKHPLVADKTIDEMLETAPEGLVNRYNALLTAIVNDEAPQAQARIDEWGAYGFNLGDETRVLMGDASGFFAFYVAAALVRKRIRDVDQ
jgi:hypothetical protein